MNDNPLTQTTKRRGFLGLVATGAAALGMSAILSPIKAAAQQTKPAAVKSAHPMHPADQWFNKVKGTHRVVYDATRPHEIMPFAWPKVFLLTNQATGSPESDCGVVVVLRHDAIGYAFKDAMWSKYGFGDLFKANEIGPERSAMP